MVKNIFFTLITLLIFFFISEIIFTTFFYFKTAYSGPLLKVIKSSDYIDQEIILQNITIDRKTNKMVPGNYIIDGKKYHINSKGFRGDDFKKSNLKNCRIISLGGSITFGVEKSYSNILSQKISDDGIECESLNFGMTTKALNYIENLFLKEVLNYSPNIITIMANRNSTMYDSYGSGSKTPGIIASKQQYYIYRINKFLFSNIMTYRFFDLSYRRVNFLISKDNTKIPNPDNPDLLHSINYFETKYFSQLTNIARVSRKHNIKLVLIKEPYYLDTNFQNKLKNLDKKDLLKRLINYQSDNYSDKSKLFWIYTNAILNKTFDEIKSINNEVIVVDPTVRLYDKKKENYFTIDGNHLNSEGHEVVADELYMSIKSFL